MCVQPYMTEAETSRTCRRPCRPCRPCRPYRPCHHRQASPPEPASQRGELVKGESRPAVGHPAHVTCIRACKYQHRKSGEHGGKGEERKTCTIMASVVVSIVATDDASWRPIRTTLTGSIMPACIISTISPSYALKPVLPVPLSTCCTTTAPSNPAFCAMRKHGSWHAFFTIFTPTCTAQHQPA